MRFRNCTFGSGPAAGECSWSSAIQLLKMIDGAANRALTQDCRKLTALVIASSMWACPVAAQDLASLLSDFVSLSDRTQRELILLKIAAHYPEAAPQLLKIATETKDTETKWLAIRAIGQLKYKEAATFLSLSVKNRLAVCNLLIKSYLR